MSAAKHTVGPWLAKQVATYSQPGWVILWPDTSKPGVHHRRLDSNGGFTEANARLIAAAPCLLEAARAVIDAVEDQLGSGWSDAEIYDMTSDALSTAYFKARDAIARATGQQPDPTR